MMKEKTIPKKVKGTVLFTVVSVLMVLIVFLMGTLALAATASNRAMKSYNSAQTQTTAKAGVQAVMAAMQNNVNIARAAADVDASNPLVIVNDITFDDASLGRITDARIEYVGTKWVYQDDDPDADNFMQMEECTIVKISATAAQGNTDSTVSAYVLKSNIDPDDNDSNNNGFVSTGGAELGNSKSAMGGTYLGFDNAYYSPLNEYIPSNENFTGTNGFVMETDIQINGNFTITQKGLIVFKAPGTGMTVWGDFKVLNNDLHFDSVWATESSISGQSYTKVPYIYVEGSLQSTNNSLGVSGMPLNIFCNDIQFVGNGGKDIYGDVYCYGAGDTSNVGTNGGGSHLYRWVASVLDASGTSITHNKGNFYTKGNLTCPDTMVFEGDVVVEGDMTINGNVEIKEGGNLKVGGNLIIGGSLNMNGGTVYCDSITGSVNNATIAPMRPGLDPSRTIPGHYELKPGYSKTILTATLYNLSYNWQDHYVWADATGANILEVIAPTASNPQVFPDYTAGTYTWTNDWSQSGSGNIPTYDEYRDAGGNVVPVSEANEWISAQFFDGAGNPIPQPVLFPAEYEKDVVLGKDVLTGHPDNSDTQIVKTVSDILNTNSSNPYNTIHEVPTAYLPMTSANVFSLNGAALNVPNVISGSGTNYTITGSCTIDCSQSNTKVTFLPPNDQEIWVVVTNWNTASGSAQWILDDLATTGKVNILLAGDVTFRPNFGGSASVPIATTKIQSILNSGDPAQIYTDSALKNPGIDDAHTISSVGITIYSELADHSFTVTDGDGLLCANIKAPYLHYKHYGNGGIVPSNSAFYYNNYDIKTSCVSDKTRVGVIGCCVIRDFDGDNNWTLLFVGGGRTPHHDSFEDALMNCWSIVNYENY